MLFFASQKLPSTTVGREYCGGWGVLRRLHSNVDKAVVAQGEGEGRLIKVRMKTRIKTVKTKTFFVAFAVAFLAHFAFGQSSEALPKSEGGSAEEKQSITITCSAMAYNLNPHTASYNTEAQILTGLYEGLFTYDPVTTEPVFAIAENYKVSRDKLRWTFKLREGLKFSDGSPLVARSVVDSWLNLLATEGAPYASLLDIIKGVKDYRTLNGKREDVAIRDTDDLTLTVQLVTPAMHLPRLLCMPCFSVTSERAIYSGAFMKKAGDAGSLTLVKNPNYVGAESVKLDEIKFIYSDDDAENAFSFNTGLSDWVASNVDLDKLLDKNAAHIMAEFGCEYLFFKMRDNIWSNEQFRAALLEAVPFDKLRDKCFVPATTLVYPMAGYPSVTGYSYEDARNAKVLMERARKSVGIGDAPLSIKICLSDTERMATIVDLLKGAWEALGVSVDFIKVAPNEYLTAIPQTDADVFCYTWIGDYNDPLAFLELFRGDSTLNVAKWQNKQFDIYLSDAALFSGARHMESLAQAEQLLLDSAVIIPIQHPVSLNVIDLDAIGGWNLNAFDIHPLKYLYKKEIEEEDFPNIVKAQGGYITVSKRKE